MMLMPQSVQYALRTMTCIVGYSARGEVPVRSQELSVKAQVPSHYISKILRKLVTYGLLKSQKGHGGGFTLAKDPKDIRFLDIMNAVGFNMHAHKCVFGWGNCRPERPCPLHKAWSKYLKLFHSWASETTLADVEWQRGQARFAKEFKSHVKRKVK